MIHRIGFCVGALALAFSIHTARAQDAPVMVSAPWGKQACEAWNNDEVLSNGLYDSGWADNHGGRGYRIIEMYRLDCAGSPHLQLKIEPKDNRAVCVDAAKKFDDKWDFLMWATTEDWIAMGKGEVGPMGGMMTGRLKFEGSWWEAMKNMGPFKNFLLLFGKVQSATDRCN